MTHAVNQFAGEFRREMRLLLARRFRWLCGTWLILFIFVLSFKLLDLTTTTSGNLTIQFDTDPLTNVLFLVGEFLYLATIVASLFMALRICKTEAQLLRAAFWMVFCIGLSKLVSGIGLEMPTLLTGTATEINQGTPVTDAAITIALAHFFVCLFLPWTPKQALMPLLSLVPVWFFAAVYFDGFTVSMIISGIVLGPCFSLTGILICWWRQDKLSSDFESKVLRREFVEASRTLFDARRIHEARFPHPIATDDYLLSYSYEPMRQIGGDFIHAHVDEHGSIHIALIDVTGHGVAAALAVNRIDGELTRLFAENPSLPPAGVIEGLNKYINLTMSHHSMFATAFCCRFNTDGVLNWTNGGHPPAFIRRAQHQSTNTIRNSKKTKSSVSPSGVHDNGLVSLDSTTFMLGACPAEIFEADCQTSQLQTGDRLILYTDGANEATDKRGKQFGIKGVSRAISHWQDIAREDIIPFLPDVVRQYRHGAAEDDVLIAALLCLKQNKAT